VIAGDRLVGVDLGIIPDANGEYDEFGLCSAREVVIRPCLDRALEAKGFATQRVPIVGAVQAQPENADGIAKPCFPVDHCLINARGSHGTAELEEEGLPGDGEGLEGPAVPVRDGIEGLLAALLGIALGTADGRGIGGRKRDLLADLFGVVEDLGWIHDEVEDVENERRVDVLFDRRLG
jgi:hypothetical protein